LDFELARGRLRNEQLVLQKRSPPRLKERHRANAFLISANSAIIDSEVVVPAADGMTDFFVLQNQLKGASTRIAMIAFDLI
jgi:ATP-dependent DNA ligase